LLKGAPPDPGPHLLGHSRRHRGGASDLDMADRIGFGAGTGSGGAVNVSMADACLGAGCGSGRASAFALMDFARGWTRARVVALSGFALCI
jgi:hypothetical protein